MIGHYLRIALRNFAHHPLSTAIKLLALSLGLLCFLAAYVFGDFLGRADTHWANAGRIYTIAHYNAPAGGALAEVGSTPPPLAKYMRLDIPEIEAVARSVAGNEVMVAAQGREETVRIRAADAELLTIFDLPFLAGDPRAALSQPDSAIIAADLARRLFGGDEAALGQRVRLSFQNSTEVTITGVIGEIKAPSALGLPFGGFGLLLTMDAYDDLLAPLPPADLPPERLAQYRDFIRAMRASEIEDWRRGFGSTYVLFAEETSLSVEELNARLATLAAQRVPADRGPVRFEAEPLESALARSVDRRVTRGPAAQYSLSALLYGFGALVLAVACLNFANLTTAQAAARSREIGLRKTIGAGRREIAIQTLMETALLAAAALVLMLIVLLVTLKTSEAAATFGLDLPSLERPGFWLGLIGIVVAVSLLAGAYPSLVLARISPLAAHRAGAAGGGGGVIRALLTGAQFAAAGALLTGIFIIALQNAELRRTGLGATEDVVAIVSRTGPPTSINALPALEVLRAELLSDPAITGYTATQSSLFQGGFSPQQQVALSSDANAPRQAYQGRSVYYDFFRTLGVPLIAGREFREGEAADAEAVIDAGTATRLGFTPESAVGETLYLSSPVTEFRDGVTSFTTVTAEVEIVGVIEEPAFELRAAGSDLYIYRHHAFPFGQSIVRISGDDVAGGLAHVRAVLERVAPDAQITIRFLDEQFEEAFRMFNRISMALMALCAVAVVIAAMGLFGMASFVVRRRVREIGVRKTLGASSARVLAMMLWDFSKPVIAANLIAWPVAYMASQAYLNLFATRIGLTPWPFLGALAVSLAIAWIAVAGQALRAARVKPALVLKTE